MFAIRLSPFKAGILLLAASALFPATTNAAIIVQSDFSNNDDEGWLLAGDATTSQPAYLPVGGNPDGMIHGTDEVTGGTWYWQAPLKFLGNKSGAYGFALTYDERMRGSGSLFSDHDILLSNAVTTLYLDFIGINPPVPGDLIWRTYSVPLTESGWKVLGTNLPATQFQFNNVLSSLVKMQIRGEFINGSDNGDLDNVVLNGIAAQVPEPGSLALFALGSLGLLGPALRRRQRKAD